ncbi:MAG TPA: hypothetical protein PKA27_11735 [Fimbriimonadaceae bacterium]|nr:hypothetical protein [Fimbriimonadaceae bacterium]
MIVGILAAVTLGQQMGKPVTGLRLVSVPKGVTRVNEVIVSPGSLPKDLHTGDLVHSTGSCLMERTSPAGKTSVALSGSAKIGSEVERISDISTWTMELRKGTLGVQEPFAQLGLYDLRLGLQPFKGLTPIDTIKALKPLTIHAGGASFRSVAGIYGALRDDRSLQVGHLIGIGQAFRGSQNLGVDARREVVIPTSGSGFVNRISAARFHVMSSIIDSLQDAGIAVRITAPPPTPIFRLNSLAATAKCTARTGTYSRDVIPYFAFSPADVATHSGTGDMEHLGIDFEKSAFVMENSFSITYAGWGLEKVFDEFGFQIDRSFFMVESDDDVGTFRVREPAGGVGTVRRPFLFKRKKKYSRVYGIGTEFEITLRADGMLVHCSKGKVGLTRKNADGSHTTAILKAGFSQLLTDAGAFGAPTADSP